jgi:hypothetical protein
MVDKLHGQILPGASAPLVRPASLEVGLEGESDAHTLRFRSFDSPTTLRRRRSERRLPESRSSPRCERVNGVPRLRASGDRLRRKTLRSPPCPLSSNILHSLHLSRVTVPRLLLTWERTADCLTTTTLTLPLSSTTPRSNSPLRALRCSLVPSLLDTWDLLTSHLSCLRPSDPARSSTWLVSPSPVSPTVRRLELPTASSREVSLSVSA